MSGVIDWGWIQGNLTMLAQLTGEHVALAILPVLAAFLISIPLGYLVFRTGRFANVVLVLLGIVSAIPSLALFVVMPAILNRKIWDPVNIVVALTAYSVILLVRSVVEGLRSVPATVNSSATAAGFGRAGRLFRVELPLAMPAVFTGLRLVTVSNIAVVSVGALIGIGALGELFTSGMHTGFVTPVVVGLVLSLLLALIFDGLILLIRRGALPWARGRRSA
ncbi:MAG: ABC transporter permease subunit [Microlunatus sp.]